MGSLSLFDNTPSWSDSFGIDTSGAFGSVGDSLGSNPFGGADGFGGLGQFAPLIAGRFG